MRKKMAGLVGALILFATGASAEYPEKPINWVFPNKAGGGIHNLALSTLNIIQGDIPQSINVTTMPGAGTVAGTRFVAEQPADGYTFLFIHDAPFQTSAMGLLGFELLDHMEPVARVAQFCLGLFAGGDAPYSNLAELQAYAIEHPNEINAAINIGSLSHINMLRLEEELGIDLNLVSVGGGGAASRQALISGEIDLIDNSPTEIGSQVRAGDVTALAWYGSERHPSLSDLSTMGEQGFQTPRTSCAYGYLWGRKDLPQEIKDYWSDIFTEAFSDPTNRDELMKQTNMPSALLTGAELAKFSKEMNDERRSAFERFGLVK